MIMLLGLCVSMIVCVCKFWCWPFKFRNLLYLISSNYEINIKYAENLYFLNIDGAAAIGWRQ